MKCRIVTRGRCGFANSGQMKFVHNPDTKQGYLVSVEETHKSVYGTSTNYLEAIVTAGSYYELGCSKRSSASSSVTWRILGEQPYQIEIP